MSDEEQQQGERPHPPMAGDMPNELEVAAAFPTADDRPLREQTSLHDADGDDIRQYTGEPVETEFGVIVPQQMAVGTERVVGGGEFPNTSGRAGGRHETSDDSAG